ncbi:MAG: hypothetical protein WC819_05075 [Parcubacteria group bacterium]|jgi:hypothetical protein
MVDLKKAGNSLKMGVGIIGSIYAGIETLKHLFGNKNASLTNSNGCLQADAKGRDQRHNTLFFTALAKASEELESDINKRNVMMSQFLTILNAQSASVRKNAMLCIGRTETRQIDNTHGEEIITAINAHGISILKSWLQMDENTLRLALQASVTSSDILTERVSKINDVCGEILTALTPTPEEIEARKKRKERVSKGPLDLLFKSFTKEKK